MPPAADSLPEPVRTALDGQCAWTGRPSADCLRTIPGGPAVLLLVAADGRAVQLLTAQQARRVATSRLCPAGPPAAGRTDLAAIVRGVRWRAVYSPFEARWWYYRLARVLYPSQYRKMISFGPAWFLHVDRARPIREIRTSQRIWVEPGSFAGPWRGHRACQQALEGLWDLFDLCRYPEQLRRMPHGRRCAYYDMGRCDAPCDGTVPPDAYHERLRQAWKFATGAVETWTQSAEERMRNAAQRQAFEQAAVIKQQLAFARKWLRDWSPLVWPDGALNLLLLVPATRRKAWRAFLFRRGVIEDGPLTPARKLLAEMPVWLRERLATPAPDESPEIRMEQTWLISHLLHRRQRDRATVIELGAAAHAPDDLETRLQAMLTAADKPSEDAPDREAT